MKTSTAGDREFFDETSIDVAPAPSLTRLYATHYGMASIVIVPRGVFPGGRVTTSHVTTDEAHSQMHPPAAGRQAFLTSFGGWLGRCSALEVFTHVHRVPLARDRSVIAGSTGPEATPGPAPGICDYVNSRLRPQE